MTEIALVMGALGLITIFIILSFMIDKKHWLFQFILISFIFITLPVLGNIILKMTGGTIYEISGMSFFKITFYLNRIFWVYLGLYLLYEVFNFIGYRMPKSMQKMFTRRNK